MWVLFAVFLRAEEGDGWRDAIALEHIEEVRKSLDHGKKYYSISSAISEERLKWVEMCLDDLKFRKFDERYDYQVIESKVLGDFCMTILMAEEDGAPFDVNIMSLGFCRIGGAWKAAPVLGSFLLVDEKGYSAEREKSKMVLRQWAENRSRKHRLIVASEKEKSLLEEVKRYQANDAVLKSGSREDAVAFFFKMLQRRDMAGILASSDMQRAFVSSLFKEEESVWSVLLGSSYLYAILPQVEGEDIVSVALYHPYNKSLQSVMELGVEREEGKWVVGVPMGLRYGEDGKLLLKLPGRSDLHRSNQGYMGDIRKSALMHLDLKAYESEAQCSMAVLKAIEVGSFQNFMSLIDWKESFLEGGLELSEGDLGRLYSRALARWNEWRNQKFSKREYMFQVEQEGVSLRLMARYSPGRLTRFEVSEVLLAEVENKGWLLVPEFRIAEEVDEDVISQVTLAEARMGVEKSQSIMIASLTREVKIESGYEFEGEEKIPDKQVEELYEAYRTCIEQGEIRSLGTLVACSEGQEEKLLEAIGRDVRAQMSTQSSVEYSEVISGENMAWVVMRIEYHQQVDPEFMAYPVVRSAEGLKILPQYLYYYEHGGGQVIVNTPVLRRIKEVEGEEFLLAYQALRAKFNQLVDSEIDKNDNE
ncbi:hypothetical protein ACFSW8_07415 [Rubritalea tangerina]|uniref:Uncharacterized protein n=1 Tax=Rubritalea tangerina TaxID=430798 RepID=A0ABW4Z9U5_9BACT